MLPQLWVSYIYRCMVALQLHLASSVPLTSFGQVASEYVPKLEPHAPRLDVPYGLQRPESTQSVQPVLHTGWRKFLVRERSCGRSLVPTACNCSSMIY